MIKLTGNNMLKAIHLFNEYTHSQAVIYSVLQESESKWAAIFVDNLERINWALLYTPNMYYVTGDVYTPKLQEQLEKLLFDTLLATEVEKELTIFCESHDWYPILESIYLPKKGFRIPRKQYRFNKNKFMTLRKQQDVLPEGAEIRGFDAETASENKAISAIWANPKEFIDKSSGACLYFHGVCASMCTAPMIGKGYAEIDIETQTNYRGRGFATLVASAVIEELLSKGLTPSWSTWPNREASQAVAQKLGFEPLPDIYAYHWNPYECK